jgi:hypothetical protein
MGAVVALTLLGFGFWAFQGWLGREAAGLLGGESLVFLAFSSMLLLTGAGLAVGAVAGFVASRAAR